MEPVANTSGLPTSRVGRTADRNRRAFPAGNLINERAAQPSAPPEDFESPLASPNRRAKAWARTVVVLAAWVALTVGPWIDERLVWSGWLAIALGLWVVDRSRGWRRFALLATWSTLAIAIAFHWAPDVLAYTMQSGYALGVGVFVPLVLWDAARALLPFWIAGLLSPGGDGLPASMEGSARATWLIAGATAVVLEALVPSVFPWRYGYMQLAWPWTVQAVDLFGPGWSTLMEFAHGGAVLWIGAVCREAWRSRRATVVAQRLCASPTIWLCVANLAYGLGAMAYWSRQIGAAPTLRLALVQADPTYLATFETLKRLSDSIDRPVDLVCWPESSGGSYEESLKNLSDADEVFRRSRDPNRGVRPWPHPRCELLLGAKLYRGDPERPDCIRQSAILLDRGENIVAAYHKRRLMPFGEYVPGEDLFPWINVLFSVQDEVTPGEEANVLQTAGGVRLGVGLCYEDMDPGAAASLTRNGAELLISLINASAFETPLTLRQHRLLAQQRAIECRRCLARCAATGETCVISPLGAVDASLPTGKEGMLIAPVKLLSSQPWGCRWPGLTPGACGALLAACAWRRARSRSGSHSAS